MKKLLIILSCLPMMAMAQVQKGVVRTAGNAKHTSGEDRQAYS